METAINKDGTAYVATNDFDEVSKGMVNAYLEKGIPVRVVADCIGHTRAAMVEGSAVNYFKERGAKQIDVTKHYSIGDYKEKYWIL